MLACEQNVELAAVSDRCMRMMNARPNHVANAGTAAWTGHVLVLRNALLETVYRLVTIWKGWWQGPHSSGKYEVSRRACLKCNFIDFSLRDKIHNKTELTKLGCPCNAVVILSNGRKGGWTQVIEVKE
jgi:hypothetical protein